MRALLLAATVSLAPLALWGQDATDPRAVRPERPTVATHAWTIAPRYLELETGVEWDRNPDASHTLLTPTLLKIGIAARTQLGPVSLDVNVGYTRRSGDGTSVPRTATLWTISTGIPLAGSLGLAAEVLGLPATNGPAGAPGTVAVLAGPTLAVRPWLALDLGVIVHLRGPQPDAVYAGLVSNLGRL